jgi:hypothetical protein
MDTNQVAAGGNTMTNANRQFPIEVGFNGTRITAAAAGVLILLGVVLQLGVLGYGHFDPRNYWLFSVFVSGIWNMLALRLNAPGVQDVLQFWPLILVGSGLAVLLVSTWNGRSRALAERNTGDRDGR